MNILIIDDEPYLLEKLQSLLTSEHYTVTTATDGRQGLEENLERQLRSDPPRHHAAGHERP